MNRRELFQGLLTLIAVSTLPAAAVVESLSKPQMLAFLLRVKQDYLNRVINPPVIMHEDGRNEKLPIDGDMAVIRWIDRMIQEERLQ